MCRNGHHAAFLIDELGSKAPQGFPRECRFSSAEVVSANLDSVIVSRKIGENREARKCFNERCYAGELGEGSRDPPPR